MRDAGEGSTVLSALMSIVGANVLNIRLLTSGVITSRNDGENVVSDNVATVGLTTMSALIVTVGVKVVSTNATALGTVCSRN